MDSPQVEITPHMWSSILESVSGQPECPECECVYTDQPNLTSYRVLDTCGHQKCSLCLFETHNRGRPCAQCCVPNPNEVVTPRRTHFRRKGFVALVRCTVPSKSRKSGLKNESTLNVTGETSPRRLRPRKVARRDDDKPDLTKKVIDERIARECLYFHGSASSSRNNMNKFVKEIAKKRKCPECKTFWGDQGAENSGPVLIVCGHFKCRKCLIAAIPNDSCHQCEADKSGILLEVGNPKKIKKRKIAETVGNSVSSELKKMNDISHQPRLTRGKKQAELNGRKKNQNLTPKWISMKREVSEEETPPPQIDSFHSSASLEPRAGRNMIEKNHHKSQPPAKKPRTIGKDDGPTTYNGKKRNVPGARGEMKNHSNCGSKAEVLKNLREESFQAAACGSKFNREAQQTQHLKNCGKKSIGPKPLGKVPNNEKPSDLPGTGPPFYRCQHCRKSFSDWHYFDHHLRTKHRTLEVENSKDIRKRKTVETERNSGTYELKKLAKFSYQPHLTPGKNVGAGNVEELETISFEKEKFHPGNKTASKDLITRPDRPYAQKKQPELFVNMPIIKEETPPPQIISAYSLVPLEPLDSFKTIEKNPQNSQPPTKKPRTTNQTKSNAQSPIPNNQTLRGRNIKKQVKLSPECVTPRRSKRSKSPACLESILGI